MLELPLPPQRRPDLGGQLLRAERLRKVHAFVVDEMLRDGATCESGFSVRRLKRPSSGISLPGVVALLQAGAPEVDRSGRPVITIPGVLAHDDSEPGLPGCKGACDLEPLP